MNVLIVGRAKTGTTVISMAIANGLGEHEYFLEPKDVELFCRQREGIPAVVKIIFEHWDRRPRLRDAIAHNELPFTFDKAVYIVRDPRDELISRMLYVAYPWCETPRYSAAAATDWLALLARKEADPAAVSLQELFDFLRERMGPDFRHLPGFQSYYNFLKRIPKWSHIVRYEDFVDGDCAALEAFLGFPLARDRDVGDALRRTRRSSAHGAWREFLSPGDVDFVKKLLGPAMEAGGYSDWTLRPVTRLDPSIYSRYVEGLIAEATGSRRRG